MLNKYRFLCSFEILMRCEILWIWVKYSDIDVGTRGCTALECPYEQTGLRQHFLVLANFRISVGSLMYYYRK